MLQIRSRKTLIAATDLMHPDPGQSTEGAVSALPVRCCTDGLIVRPPRHPMTKEHAKEMAASILLELVAAMILPWVGGTRRSVSRGIDSRVE